MTISTISNNNEANTENIYSPANSKARSIIPESFTSSSDSLTSRAIGGLFDIIKAVVNVALAPLRILFGDASKAVFDLVNLPITIIKSVASLSGSASVKNAFEEFQLKIATPIVNRLYH